mgnify:CR=1 FL=1
MQGLILAAGMGKRLGKHTQDQTKGMVKVNGITLIERAINTLVRHNITRIVIVVGYKGDKLRRFIKSKYPNLDIVFTNNPIYDTTNNIYSLWLAKKYLIQEDTILLESDVIFEDKILKGLMESPHKNLAVVAKYESWMDGTVTLVDGDDNITNFISKKNFDWDKVKHYYKTVNIYKFSKEFCERYYVPFLDAYIKTMGNNEYYEQVLKVITYLDRLNLKAYQLDDEKWYEIDDVQDLDIAETLFAEKEEELVLYQRRFGGYWRYPKLKDFCYLVNPYFPNERMLNELKSNFSTLITQYPSGLEIQNLLAAKMFGCEASEILVGNGASEFINSIFGILPGKVGVVYPTFNEYPERARNRVVEFIPKNMDFEYTVAELKELSDEVEVIVLINPDNPSGHFLMKKDVVDLLDYLKKENKYLILDESFIDFAEENVRFSMIDSEILQQYPNLIIIKSISKSYGVPGVRLGVLACGNPQLISEIRKKSPIWNINSFGEYFLQIIGKYKNEYYKACNSICEERTRFYQELKKIKFLRVLPSMSNYFLCEVTQGFTATDLSKILLNNHQIFIKDCTGKKGFEGKNYVRIAVRDSADNTFLTEKLKKM